MGEKKVDHAFAVVAVALSLFLCVYVCVYVCMYVIIASVLFFFFSFKAGKNNRNLHV